MAGAAARGADPRARPADHRHAPSPVGPPRAPLPAARAAGRHRHAATTSSATVFLECHSMYRAAGPPEMRPVGETEFVNGVAAMSASGIYGADARLRRHRRLRRPDAGRSRRAGAGGAYPGRRRAVPRHPPLRRPGTRREVHRRPLNRDAAAALPATGLPRGLRPPGRARACRFDAWLFHPQLAEVDRPGPRLPGRPHRARTTSARRWARAATPGKREEVFAIWKAAMPRARQLPNVVVKLGGLAMASPLRLPSGDAAPPSSDAAGRATGGPTSRPASRRSAPSAACSRATSRSTNGHSATPTLWNAFKRIASGASADEKPALFSRHRAAGLSARLSAPIPSQAGTLAL